MKGWSRIELRTTDKNIQLAVRVGLEIGSLIPPPCLVHILYCKIIFESTEVCISTTSTPNILHCKMGHRLNIRKKGENYQHEKRIFPVSLQNYKTMLITSPSILSVLSRIFCLLIDRERVVPTLPPTDP